MQITMQNNFFKAKSVIDTGSFLQKDSEQKKLCGKKIALSRVLHAMF